jgi:hypothetical protein
MFRVLRSTRRCDVRHIVGSSLFAATMALLLASTAALAAKPHTLKTTFGTFTDPSGIAIDEANGNVFVADGEPNNAIEILGPEGGAPTGVSGTRIGGFAFNGEPSGLAIDNSSGPSAGDLYVTDVLKPTGGSTAGVVDKFKLGPASEEYELVETLKYAEPFTEPLGVAVNSLGEVAVGSYGAAQSSSKATGVVLSDAAGVERTRLAVPSRQPPSAVAFDSAGDLYVQIYSSGEVWRFLANNAGAVEAETEAEEIVSGGATGLAVDQASDVLYVAMGDHVAEYNPSGELEGEFGSGTLSASERVAVGSGNIYVTQRGAGHNVAVFDLEPSLAVRSGQATDITGEAATAEGSVDPSGAALTACRFEYVTAAAFAATKFSDLSSGGTAPCTPAFASIPVNSGPQTVSGELGGLEAGHRYYYRLEASDVGETVAGVARSFFTVGIPLSETTGSFVRTATSALLEGRITAAHGSVSYHFEYGTAGPCGLDPCAATAAVPAGEPEMLKLVAQRVGGLTPDTTYHYRVVAENGSSSGPSFGQDMTITTRASDAPLSHGSYPGPPESDRAWEQVNAPDTGGTPISELKAIAPDGDSVIYEANGGTPQSTIGGANTPLFAERTENGWLTRSITPSGKEARGKNWFFLQASSDLSRVSGLNTRPGGLSGAAEVWEFPPFGPTRALVPELPYEDSYSLAISANGSRSVLTASGSLDPSRPAAPGTFDLYDISGANPKLISLLPNGEAPPCGASVENGVGLPVVVPVQSENWISPDGSVAYFPSEGTSCGGQPQLYARFLGPEETRRLSPPPLAGEECSAYFIKSTPASVYFWTQSMLTPEDQPSGEACGQGAGNGSVGGDIYRYGLASGQLKCVTCLVVPGSAADVELADAGQSGSAQMAVAENGSRIYFKSERSLVPGAATQGLYRFDPQDGALHYVAPIGNSKVGEFAADGEALSGDGNVIVFESGVRSLNPVGGMSNGESPQLYLYDDRTEALTCASCPQDGAPAGASVALSYGQGGLVTSEFQGGANVTPISEDGLTFAFSTPNALVPADRNTPPSGQAPIAGADAYEWRDGRLLLVTDGTTDWSSTVPGESGTPPDLQTSNSSPKVAGVSASGQDIYFTVAAKLTPDAPEPSQRLYDARIGGGFQFPIPLPPCDLNSGVCEGAATRQSSQPGAATSVFSGPANPSPKGRCPKGKRAVRKGGKTRCVNRGHHRKRRRKPEQKSHKSTSPKHKHHAKRKKQHATQDRRNSR